MAISNLQEKLLFYTQQKSRISAKLGDIQMRQLSATRTEATKQQEYNAKLTALYYDDVNGFGTDGYSEILLELQNDHEFEMASLNAWEAELELQKENYETQFNEISGYESAWQKLILSNIKNDFMYGGQGGK